MNSKKCPLRPMGQRSIASTFLFRAPNRSIDCKKILENEAPSKKGSPLSLSEFLNRKLQRSSGLPSSVQGKELPFSSPLSGKKEGGDTEAKFSIDGAFHMFKNVEKDKNDPTSSCSNNETVISDVDGLQQTRKRKNLSEGCDDKLATRRRVVVLGEDSKPIQSSTRKNFLRKDSTPLFNHYENGGGWWDNNMEGVDNEEVGCNEVWEGVGCTTLGGIEWH